MPRTRSELRTSWPSTARTEPALPPAIARAVSAEGPASSEDLSERVAVAAAAILYATADLRLALGRTAARQDAAPRTLGRLQSLEVELINQCINIAEWAAHALARETEIIRALPWPQGGAGGGRDTP